MRRWLLLGVLAFGRAGAETPLERARAAVAAEPDRPGLRLALADLLIEAGDPDGAEAEARRVLADWPASTRARLVLARVAEARGEGTAGIEAVAATAPAAVAAEARRYLDAGPAWHARGVAGVDHDSSAAGPDVDPIGVEPGTGVPAWRALVAAEAGVEGGTLGARAGADRTVHLDAAPEADRTSFWLELRRGRATGFGGRLEGRATLAGRDAAFHDAGGGASAWWQGGGAVAPWVQARGLYFRLADDEVAEGELSSGLAFAGRPVDGGLRVAALAVRPGFTELGGDADAALHLDPVTLFARAGAGWRREDVDSVRPRAGGGASCALGGGVALVGEAAWEAASSGGALRDRLVAGVRVEVAR